MGNPKGRGELAPRENPQINGHPRLKKGIWVFLKAPLRGPLIMNWKTLPPCPPQLPGQCQYSRSLFKGSSQFSQARLIIFWEDYFQRWFLATRIGNLEAFALKFELSVHAAAVC